MEVQDAHHRRRDDPVRTRDGEGEVTTRYDWTKAPEWAMWAATDEDGDRYWYEEIPRQAEVCDFWVADEGRGQNEEILPLFAYCPDWRESLERRPDVDATGTADDQSPLGSALQKALKPTIAQRLARIENECHAILVELEGRE